MAYVQTMKYGQKYGLFSLYIVMKKGIPVILG